MAVICVILGLCAISAGVGMLCIPAGVITAGASLVALGLVWIRGKSRSEPHPNSRPEP